MISNGTRQSKMTARIHRVIILVIIASFVFLLSSCGADVSSSMIVDKNFSGTRTITLDLSTGDNPLDYVEGGLDTIIGLAESNMPSVLEMKVGDNIIDFTMNFNGLDDYRSQINALFSAGNLDAEPVIEFVYEDSIFAKRVYFYEEVDSDDLLNWLFNAIEESGAVSRSRSDWYEVDSKSVEIAGVQYSLGYSNKIDEGSQNYLDMMEVYTDHNLDGSLNREIVFYAEDSTYSWFVENGSDIDQFMSDLTPDNAVYEKSYSDEKEATQFSFKIANTDPAGVTAFTNHILATESASFDFNVQASPDLLGKAVYQISENISFGHYVDDPYNYSQSYHNFSSPVSPVPGTDSGVRFNLDESYEPSPSVSYNLVSGESKSFACEAGIEMNLQNAILDLKNQNEMEYVIEIVYDKNSNADLIEIGVHGLTKAAQDIAELSDGENGEIVLMFTGLHEDVIDSIDTFLNRFVRGAVIETAADEEPQETENTEETATGGNAEDDETDIIELYGQYSNMVISPQQTDSRFTQAYQLKMSTDWSSLFSGDIPFTVNAPGGSKTYIVDHVADEEGKVIGQNGMASISVLVVNTTWIAVVLMVLIILVLLASIVLLIINRSEIARAISYIKARIQTGREARQNATPAITANASSAAADPVLVEEEELI